MFTIRRPPAEIFGAPTFLLSPNKKKQKKGRHYFFGFSYRLLAPPGAFWRPLELFGAPLELFAAQIFFLPPPNVNLANVWYICSQITLIRNFGAPFSWRPPATPGQLGLRYATGPVTPKQAENHALGCSTGSY